MKPLADPNDTLTASTTKRGYTMHEHMDEMGVINMNGRVYDPLIGRFLTADPHIQAPDDLQSFNRYSYVKNNPLAYTDPSGYFFKKLWKKVKKVVVAVVIVVAAVYTAGLAASAAAGAMGYSSVAAATVGAGATYSSAIAVGAAAGAAGSFTSTLLATGNVEKALKNGVKGAIAGGVTAGVTHGIADFNWGRYMNGEQVRVDWRGIPVSSIPQRGIQVLGSSVASGVSNAATGGSFSAGASGALPYNLFGEASSYMRTEMAIQSAKHPINSSGVSAGVGGDGFKVGGERGIYDDDGGVKFSSDKGGPMGGNQGGIGRFGPLGSYGPGSIQDSIVEHFAGPHDFLNSWTYDSQGMYAAGDSALANIGNYANVLTATPFVFGHAVTNYMPGAVK